MDPLRSNPNIDLYPNIDPKYLPLNPSNNLQQQNKDENKKILKEIMLRVLSTADRLNRTLDNPKIPKVHDKIPEPFVVKVPRFYSFRRSNHLDNFVIPAKYESLHIFKNVCVSLGVVFLGKRISYFDQDQRSDDEMMSDACEDNSKWLNIKSKYPSDFSENFHTRIYDIMTHVINLISVRQENLKETIYKLIFFYSSLSLSIFARAINQKYISYFGLSTATIIFIFIVKQNFDNYMRRSFLEFTLKSEIEEAYNLI